jgi:hypothetical protein
MTFAFIVFLSDAPRGGVGGLSASAVAVAAGEGGARGGDPAEGDAQAGLDEGHLGLEKCKIGDRKGWCERIEFENGRERKKRSTFKKNLFFFTSSPPPAR